MKTRHLGLEINVYPATPQGNEPETWASKVFFSDNSPLNRLITTAATSEDEALDKAIAWIDQYVETGITE